MIDRGFDIADIFPSGVTLNTPSSKEGKDQLNLEKTDETARIAAVRIHVERGIGRIKKLSLVNDNFDESSIQGLHLFDQFFNTTCTTK